MLLVLSWRPRRVAILPPQRRSRAAVIWSAPWSGCALRSVGHHVFDRTWPGHRRSGHWSRCRQARL